ncbi:cytochrome c oxidase accessory protein FixG [Tahibacter aquaticus]|uniref:Cytochrome c oxidase accessory protein FixG n=1 Tax=Tahibacter aquaticus TaxID=520092 RepID=A0A4R6YQH5_9GAMM|nr:4Fe-4S dicluster domain-containing protein [Tahibacter aquaticus]TDR39972.1 cytochrome c oxidase accessory protein FixG [Tahibacter aquaticus]
MSKRIPVLLQDAAPAALYQAEGKVYPRSIRGRYDRLRRLAVVVLLGMYYVFPWLQWDGRQAVLFDLPARRFYVFGLAFWPQDFVFLALLLIIAGIALFFFTAVAGRLWCGYACPQTVWTEVFLWMEQWTEGDRLRRLKLDAAPWTRDKLQRKAAKHALWLLFALWTGFTFVAFFTPARELAQRVPSLTLGGWETFWILFYALATWGNAGVLREQVCKYMCPYARFQGAMFDRNTLIIAYDPLRGEPRGPRQRGLAGVAARGRGLLSLAQAEYWLIQAQQYASAALRALDVRRTTAAVEASGSDVLPAQKAAVQALGDCIDCTWCVQVCPVGIDIRNGLQYECIACGACIDACDQVMDKLDYPRGLIRYSTQNAVDAKPTRVLRPRVIVYGLLLLALLAGWSWGVLHRSPLIVEVLRDRNALYRVAVDGAIENGYSLKLANKLAQPRRLRIATAPGSAVQLRQGAFEVELAAESVLAVPLTLAAPAAGLPRRQDISLLVENVDGTPLRVAVTTAFFGPVP